MLRNYKKQIIILFGFIVVSIIVFLIISYINSPKASSKFSIISTEPTNGATDVYPGEIKISFTTDQPINSIDDYIIEISPNLQNGGELISSFPTTTVTNRVLGGLEKNTTYTITVTNKNTDNKTSWSFTTSGEQPESSSALFKEEQEQLEVNYYPLFDFLPYENENIKMFYTGRQAITVEIKNGNEDSARQEVEEWIKSHKVDPSTHAITYKII